MSTGTECTNYVAFVESSVYGVPTPNYDLGNATSWASVAESHGVTVNQTPTVGSVAQWNAGDHDISSDGHVAIVEQVGPNDSYIIVSQDNWSSDKQGYGWAVILNGTPNQGEPWPDRFIHFQTTTTLSYRQPTGLIQSTGNLYWTSNQSVDGSWQAEVYRASKDNEPGQERILYQESSSTPIEFAAITYADVAGTYYGYFVADYPEQNESEIKQVPLAGGGAVVLASSPGLIGDLVTDGSFLYWADEDGIRKMAITGGTVQTIVSGTTLETQLALGGLDGQVLYYSSANNILSVPTSGGASTTLVSAASKVTALEAPLTPNGEVYFGEANGSVHNIWTPDDLVYQLQAPAADVSITSVSGSDDSLLWGECLVDTFGQSCTVDGDDNNGTAVSVPTSTPPRDVQGDASAWYWGDTYLEKYTLDAAASPPHGFSLTDKGNILAQLHKPHTLVLLVYATPQHSAQHLTLLGRVTLGKHPAGLSQITWGLRVDGHRLRAGDYLAELEALVDGAFTTGGPIVHFDLGQSGKLTILAQSFPARARDDAIAATGLLNNH